MNAFYEVTLIIFRKDLARIEGVILLRKVTDGGTEVVYSINRQNEDKKKGDDDFDAVYENVENADEKKDHDSNNDQKGDRSEE